MKFLLSCEIKREVPSHQQCSQIHTTSRLCISKAPAPFRWVGQLSHLALSVSRQSCNQLQQGYNVTRFPLCSRCLKPCRNWL